MALLTLLGVSLATDAVSLICFVLRVCRPVEVLIIVVLVVLVVLEFEVLVIVEVPFDLFVLLLLSGVVLVLLQGTEFFDLFGVGQPVFQVEPDVAQLCIVACLGPGVLVFLHGLQGGLFENGFDALEAIEFALVLLLVAGGAGQTLLSVVTDEHPLQEVVVEFAVAGQVEGQAHFGVAHLLVLLLGLLLPLPLCP